MGPFARTVDTMGTNDDAEVGTAAATSSDTIRTEPHQKRPLAAPISLPAE
jgi:hypothetical protein